MTNQLFDILNKYMVAIALGIFGGCVRDLNSQNFSFRLFIVGIFTTAFVAIVVSLLVEGLDITFSLKAVIIAMSGYMSKVVLDMLNNACMKRIKDIVDREI